MATSKKKLSVEEYLELEKTSEIRHEYVDGHRLEMTGEKRRHNTIVGHLLRVLSPIAEEKGYELVFESIKVQTRVTRFRYPNIAISLWPGEDDYILANPCFIAELTSHNNQDSLMQRLHEYMSLPSLQSYIYSCCRR